MRNEDIVFDELRVVDENKEMIGVMSTDEALEMAAEQDLDLVVMSPDADPPLARIMNYSKYKYEKEKKDTKKEEKTEPTAKRGKSDKKTEEEENEGGRMLIIFRPKKSLESLWAPMIHFYTKILLPTFGGELAGKQAPLPIERKLKERRNRR